MAIRFTITLWWLLASNDTQHCLIIMKNLSVIPCLTFMSFFYLSVPNGKSQTYLLVEKVSRDRREI